MSELPRFRSSRAGLLRPFKASRLFSTTTSTAAKSFSTCLIEFIENIKSSMIVLLYFCLFDVLHHLSATEFFFNNNHGAGRGVLG